MSTPLLPKKHIRNGLRAAFIKRENSKWPDHLVEVPKEDWPTTNNLETALAGVLRTRVMRSNKFLVQAFHRQSDGEIRISVVRAEIGPDSKYLDGISWDDLQQIKRELGWGHLMAVEIYPADKDIVNVANMRHLWIPAKPIDIGWKK